MVFGLNLSLVTFRWIMQSMHSNKKPSTLASATLLPECLIANFILFCNCLGSCSVPGLHCCSQYLLKLRTPRNVRPADRNTFFGSRLLLGENEEHRNYLFIFPSVPKIFDMKNLNDFYNNVLQFPFLLTISKFLGRKPIRLERNNIRIFLLSIRVS